MKFATALVVYGWQMAISEVQAMLGKCANPACEVPFRYLRGGKLFLLDIADPKGGQIIDGFDRHLPHRITYFWLCDDCAARMSVSMGREGEAVIQAFRP